MFNSKTRTTIAVLAASLAVVAAGPAQAAKPVHKHHSGYSKKHRAAHRKHRAIRGMTTQTQTPTGSSAPRRSFVVRRAPSAGRSSPRRRDRPSAPE
jgi:hypothetical protein